ncbi:MAG: NADH-ubiquinone oxidoreductase-F iron-sulfur binding region domain-containing protein [Cyclobacteriaceae bacterium]|nr:NAD(P)H-dependent oxidoreductase subunit E [Cyclobacteriaceae bacterium]
MSENLSKLARRKGLENPLFEQLVSVSKEKRVPSPEEMRSLAREFLVGNAVVHGTVSFYDFLKSDNQNKKVFVCNGSACMVAGTQDTVKEKLLQHFSESEIGHMCCLGRCHENSAYHYNGRNYSGDRALAVEEVLKDKGVNTDQYHVKSNLKEPILTNPYPDENSFFPFIKECLGKDKDQLLNEIKKSNIRGRGGAGFPMGLKLESCKNVPGNQKFVVCNADEGDPGAYSDRYLLEKQPHLLLFGMMMAGYIIGANRGVIYIRGEYPESIEEVRNEIHKWEKRGFLGENIQNTGFDFRFKIIEGAGAYICGEETALLSSIEGQRPEVRVRPPYPTQEGLFNQPTVVNNVETSASVYYILKNGGDKYASLGTGKSTGSKLVCLDSFFNNPGMYEIEMGTPLSAVVNDFGKGFKKNVKAIHVGGPLGGIVPVERIESLTLDFESFASNGFLLGHAGVVSIPVDFPMIKYLEHLFEFTAAESCGKCFPCSIGSTRGKELIQKAQKEDFKIDRKLMDDLLETLEIGSLCALGGGLPLGIKNALQYFDKELKAYFA